jgi:hypothetical protein
MGMGASKHFLREQGQVYCLRAGGNAVTYYPSEPGSDEVTGERGKPDRVPL